MNKGGFSTVIVSMVLILITLVAIGIVAVVIGDIIQENSKKISVDGIFVNLGVNSVKVNDDGSVSVAVKRGAGSGELNAVRFVLSDGESAKVIERAAELNELEQKIYTFGREELGGLDVKDVSIAPIIRGIPKEIVSVKEVTNQTQTIENREVIVINFASLSSQQDS
ncbi:hypothetical protein HY449_02155 [Candidatus Pacearchaeota archaeon]|nr:hypothetical protein [Candidatus Pacearchaeota archaeon]